MRQPWAALRALGIYKPKDAEWGWDFISEVSMRIAIGDTGYSTEDYAMYFYDGTFLGIPSIFSIPFGDKGWESFLARLVLHWKDLAKKVFIGAISTYMTLAFVIGCVVSFYRFKKGTKACTPIWTVMLRNTLWLCFFMSVIASCAHFGMSHMSDTNWAKEIKVILLC